MEDWLEIGEIVAAQGLKGEIRVSSATDFPERFEQAGKRWLLSPNNLPPQEMELLKGRYIPGKSIYVITLAGIENREQAEALRGYKLLVPKSDRPQLAEDEYHVTDLINLEVFNQLNGENLGKVTDVLAAGNDLLEVTLAQQPVREEIPKIEAGKINRKSKIKKTKTKVKKPLTLLIPFVKDIVPIVDIKEGRIEVIPPPGLLELSTRS